MSRARGRGYLSLAAAAVMLASPGGRAGEARTAWTANDISVVETTPGREASANTRFEVGNNGDARITVALHDAAHSRGTIVLIAGRWMLSQGFSTAANEIHAMDVAALNSQLVIVLLTAALPQGPPPPGSPRHAHVTEKNNPIRIATETAAAQYSPPWTVDGTVSLPNADAPVSYHLTFTWSAHEHEATRVFSGTLADAGAPVSFPDSMKLAGWNVREIAAQREGAPGANTTPGGAAGSARGGGSPSPKVATVGELRRLP